MDWSIHTSSWTGQFMFYVILPWHKQGVYDLLNSTHNVHESLMLTSMWRVESVVINWSANLHHRIAPIVVANVFQHSLGWLNIVY